MTYLLEGLQYRASTEHNQSFRDTGKDWLDIPEKMISFPAHTQFRIKPLTTYQVSVSLNTTTHTDIAVVHKVTANLLEQGQSYQVSVFDKTPAWTRTNLQFRQPDSASKSEWQDATKLLGANPLRMTYATEFRQRPDHYHVVDTLDTVVRGSVVFHDIEELAAYVDKRIRTNGLDFKVSKVKYGL